MSMKIEKNQILLTGAANIEDAESLLAALIDYPSHVIEITGLTYAHLAIVQLLHAAGRPIIGQPDNAFLREIAFVGLIRIRP